jgi:hypothetical protein
MSAISAPVEMPLHRRPAVRWAAGIVAVLIALNLLAVVVASFLVEPSGPASSSYATSSRGLAAYAELLSRLGHPVTQLRRPPDDAVLAPGSTVVLLDPATTVGPSDLAALRRFVAGGGRLVAGGAGTAGLASALAGTPIDWIDGGPRFARTAGAVAGVGTVQTAGAGRYDCRQAGRVLAGPSDAALLCAVRGGRVLLLSDSSPLNNSLLARADNAALGVALAGARGRPVVFAENVHGYRTATGLAALPSQAWWAVGLLALAAVVYLVARWRRLGPAVLADEIAAPARREHVDALAAALGSAGDRAPAAARLRDAARAIVIRRGGLRPYPADSQLEDAAARLGLGEHDVALLIGETARGEDLVGLGRLLAHLRSEGT